MAAVYARNDGSLQSNNEILSSEYDKGAAQEVNIDQVSSSKASNAKNTDGEMELSPSGPILKAQDHAEVVAANSAAAPVKIKREQAAEDECVVVHTDEIEEENLADMSTNKRDSTERDKSVEVKLCTKSCKDCGQRFTNRKAFRIHIREHVNEKRKGDRQVESVTNGNDNRLRYVTKKKKVKEEKETDEDESVDGSRHRKPSEILPSHPAFDMLLKEEKPVFVRTNRVYVCAVCGKVYSYFESFRNHQKLHIIKAQQPEIRCEKCQKTFSRLVSLTLHLKLSKQCVPEEPSDLHCERCDQSFASAVVLASHQEMHKQRPFWCDVCAKGFRSSVGLERHLLGHENKKHTCDICQKSFRVAAELRYHYNIHTGAKPYTCDFCYKSFSQMGNLITHRKKHLEVFKEGEAVPLGKRHTGLRGKNRVSVMKKVVLRANNVFGQDEVMKKDPNENCEEKHVDVNNATLPESHSPDTCDSSDISSDEPQKCLKEDQEFDGDWQCIDCSAHFTQESELHMHYMKHASGEI
ncbi:zinc finger protein 184 isoform X2 [Carassius auratus]|uniref:Zinc finger protein 184 isoform X2 n=1 Tax=Carassius auratus TaxID=7957 RepID=A0A6P6R4S1_CARAU|nr:zinc finger protein 184-like isoform X2 [Carassius auratus]